MKRILGIDLGTVHSCVAIPSDDEEGKAMVVKDDMGRSTIPSVVMQGKDSKYVVGHLAKQRIGTKKKPVAFVKRYMGKDHQVDLGDERVTPEFVSAQILKYLAELAQKQVGEEFKQVVITIPARFELPGQQATVEAARLAGLEVLTTMPEPVAAALAYGLQDEEDDVVIFCYDLGGGTFDATIMKKDPELGIDVLAFDGDPQLGGYNFDKILATWILNKLQETYSLDIDWEKEDDQLIFQKLMMIAEQAKKELSDHEEYVIHKEEVFEDHDGEPVEIDLTITRQEFEDLISTLAADTISISLRAVSKAKLTSKDIDRVIMVGGSSRIPMISRILAKEFACAPQLVDPDTIVARGAAIKAGSMTGNITEGIEFLSDLPKSCPLERFDIFAKVSSPDPGDLRVQLERDDGGYEAETTTAANGNFEFHGIELLEEENNTFELIVGDSDKPRVRYSFAVQQNSEKIPESNVGNVNFITQDVSLMISTGFCPVFREGESIPKECQVTLKSIQDNEMFLRFDVYNGNQYIGEVFIDNIQPGLPAESEILVNIAITDDLKVNGTATLVKTGQSASFSFRIPKPKQMNVDELRINLTILQEEFAEVLESVQDVIAKMEFMSKGERLIKQLDNEFAHQPCDDTKIQRLISELKTLIQEISVIDIMTPSFKVFEDLLADARQKAAAVEKENEKARMSNFPAVLNGIEEFGRESFSSKNKKAWAGANEQVAKVMSDINFLIHEKLIKEIPPEIMADYMRKELEDTLGNVRTQLKKALDGPRGGNYRRFEPELDKLIREFNMISLDDPQAAIRTGQKLFGQTRSLAERIKLAGETKM